MTGSDVIFSAGADVVGLRSRGDVWRLVFLSFPFEPIVNNPYPNNPPTLISRVIDWFEPFEASVKTDLSEQEMKRSFPNPFRGTTMIRFGSDRIVSARIYDVQGRLVRKVEGQIGVFEWDGRDQSGKLLPSGLYFCKVDSGGAGDCLKLVLLR